MKQKSIGVMQPGNPRYYRKTWTKTTPNTMPRKDYSPSALLSIVVFLMGGLLASSAQAEWIALGRDENFRLYVDQKSLQRNGDLVRVFQLMDFVTAQWADERTVVGSIRTLVEYDCVQPRSRTIALDAYSEQMGDGRRVASEQLADPEWGAVTLGSASERIRQLVCGK